MKGISHHIRKIHEKPHHIRKRIAFTTAGVGAGLFALVWLVGSVSAGVFALKPTSFAQSSEGATVDVTNSDTADGSDDVAGAAAAPAVDDANAPAHIVIVDVAASTSPKAEQTTIPF